jgi:hypothetical protein
LDEDEEDSEEGGGGRNNGDYLTLLQHLEDSIGQMRSEL